MRDMKNQIPFMNSIPFPRSLNPKPGLIGIVGLGLLGRGIVAGLLGHGYHVRVFDISPRRCAAARREIATFLADMAGRPGFRPSVVRFWRKRYREVSGPRDMGGCDLVIESITEKMAAKRGVYRELESVLPSRTPIVSNTSAIPITLIQKGVKHPARFVGMHWLEPAHISEFMEIIRGRKTGDDAHQTVIRFARSLGKETTLVKRDIRGFVANRLYAAMVREAFHVMDQGVADVQTIDRAFRTTFGWWAIMTGPFRNMDLTGLEAAARVFKDLIPTLSTSKAVPRALLKIVRQGRGKLGTRHGFYRYTPRQLARWKKELDECTWDMREVAAKYAHLHQR